MLDFVTSTGNGYAWDDEVGLFVPFPPVMKAVNDELSKRADCPIEVVMAKLSENYSKDDIIFCCQWINKWKKIKPQSNAFPGPKDFSVSYVRDYVQRYITQLILSITEDCNFRCRYCIFSGNYEGFRDHSKRYMDFGTAKTAIDQFFQLIEMKKRYNPLNFTAITFYGGEPLLNFSLIKECVNYINARYSNYDPKYNITTNGSLLSEDKANWLMQQDFGISVSLDGPEEEHDRNRIYASGRGTFKDVMRNIRRIMDSGYENISCNPVIDWKTDIFKLQEFFNRKDVPKPSRSNQVVTNHGCRYYEEFTEEDYITYVKRLKMAKEYYLNTLPSLGEIKRATFFDQMFRSNARSIIANSIPILKHPLLMPFTAACVPGRKIFVDPDGNYYICERICTRSPIIGNINEGLNFERIYNMLYNYYNHLDKCPSCSIQRVCNQCFSQLIADGTFLKTSEVCRDIEKGFINAFIDSFELAEANPLVGDRSDSYDNIKKHYEV